MEPRGLILLLLRKFYQVVSQSLWETCVFNPVVLINLYYFPAWNQNGGVSSIHITIITNM